jgi:hypothetical protein
MFFVQDYRERIKEENPDASFGEVGKLLGAKWKEMSDAEKKVRVYLLLVVNLSRSALREEGYCRQSPSIRRQGRLRCRREGSCPQEDQGPRCRVSPFTYSVGYG